jgi:hypothetical protein
MPRKRKAPNTPRDRLARLTLLPDLILEGAARPLNIAFEDGDGARPWSVLWVDATTGYVRASGILEVRDDGVLPEDEVNGLFAEACGGPFIPTDSGTAALVDEMAARRGHGPVIRDDPPPPAGLPALVRVEAGAMVAAVRALAEPLGVQVEESAPGTLSPLFEQAYTALNGYLERQFGGEPQAPFAWDIAREAVAPLVKAAGGLWRRAPWNYLPDHPPLAVRLGEHGPEPGVEEVYASILGGGGMVEGVALYFSAEGFRQALRQGMQVETVDQNVDQMIDLLRQSGAPVAGVPDEMLRGVVGDLMMQSGIGGADSMMPQQSSLALLFGPAEDEDPTYLDWLKERDLKAPSREGVPSFYRTAAGEQPRQPNEREVRAMVLAVDALNQYFSKHANTLQGPMLSTEPLLFATRVESAGEPVAVTVTFPPRDWDFDADEEALGGDDEDEEDDEVEELQPASLDGMRTVYRFKVVFQDAKDLWRRIELRGDQTLDDLHYAIQAAFDWDNDHLYSFYLSGKAWDTDTEYTHPDSMEEGRSAAAYRLEHLPLHARQRLMYIFDFGDELRHIVTLEAITPGGVTPGTTYPRITETHGENVPQYANAEDEDADELDEEGDEDE